MFKMKVIQLSKVLNPQTGKVHWVAVLQAVADTQTLGGQLQLQLASAPAFDVGDVLEAAKAA